MLKKIVSVVTLFVLLISVVYLMGYFYSVPALSDHALQFPKTPFFAMVLILVCVVIISKSPRGGMFAIFFGDGLGPTIARRLLPSAFVVLMLLGWLKLEGHRQQAFGIEVGTMMMVVANKDSVLHIVSNLLSNAIKFTDRGTITLSTRRCEDNVEVAVSDQGIGIRPEDMDKLFKSFSQIYHEDRRYAGTGLGLVICKKLAEQQGGKIKVESSFGNGSTFCLTLPISEEIV